MVRALPTRSLIVSTLSGPSLSKILPTTGTSTALTNLVIGRISRMPIGAAFSAAEDRSSSVAPAALARSLPSPAAALTPSNPATPVAAAVATLAGAARAVAAAGTAIPATDPNALERLYVIESSSPPSGRIASAVALILSRIVFSASSSRSAAIPSEAVSPTSIAPAPNPLAIFSKNPASSSSF